MATIPLSWNDPLFSGVTNSGSVTLRNGGTLSYTSITDSGLIASVVLDDGSTTLDHVRINSEEGVRIGGSGNITISNSYIETTGLAGDHADGIQAYDPGGTGNVTITNTTIVSHDSNATSGMFIADGYSGTFTFNNVVFEGGPFGLRIAADAGAGHDDYVSLTNVYFVGPFMYDAFLFQNVNANIHITQWDNVRYATIVNGVLVPGALIPSPFAVEGGSGGTPAAPVIATFSTDSGVVGDHITNDNTLTLSGTAAANSTVKVFDGTTQVATATADSSGAWSSTATTALANGSHNLTATATNASGTSTASAAFAVTIDTVAPNAPVETGASIVSGTTMVQLTGTAEANSTLQVFDGTTQVGTATANSSGAWSLTTGTLASGGHSLTTKATDAAGNISVASAALAVTIPSAPTTPAAPTIASFSPDTGVVGDGITDANTLTLKGTAAANSTVTVFDGSTQIGTTTANSSGSWSYITSVLTDAIHVLKATDTVSGVTSAASSPLSVTVDTVAPAAPVLVSDSVVNTNHVLLSGTAEANSSIKVYDGTTVVGTGTTSSTGTWSVTTTAPSNGMNALTATATDVAGNVSAVSQALDPVIGTAPTPPPPTPPAPLNLVVNGGFEAGNFTGWTLGGNYAGQTLITTNAKVGTYAAALGPAGSDGTLSQSLSTTAGQQYTLDFWLANMSSGPDDFAVKWNGVSVMALVNAPAQNYTEYTFNVTGTAGTSNLEFDFRQDPTQWRLDNISVMPVAAPAAPTPPPTPPAAPQITSFSTDSGIAGDHITNDNTPMLTGTAVANSTVNVFDGTTPIGTTIANSSGQWHLTTPVLSDGTHSLTTTDTDMSGHTSAPSAAFSVSIDTHAPGAPTMAVYSQGGSAMGNATTLSDLVLKGTAEANSTIDIFDGAKQIGTTTTNGSGAWSLDTGHLANGSHSFTATAIDVAGNTSAASATDGVTVSTPSTPSTPTKPIEFTNVSENWNDSATIKGTADAYSQIKIYDGTTSLGTVTASAQGTWSFTTTQLSDTLHTFKAQELDSTGHVVATSSGAAIVAASNTSTLTGTGGDDFLFSSSSQLNDTFVFASNFGHSTIQGFTVAGPGQDTIQFSKSVFDSFASVLSHASQVGQDVVISSGSDTLKLLNTKLGALNSHDFHFA